MTRGACAAVQLVSWALLSCASPHTIEPELEGAPDVATFLVCAPNTVIGLPAELQDGSKPLRDAVDRHLRENGRSVEWLSLYDSKKSWNEALARAKAADDISKTPEHFARDLAARAEFDAIVLPSIVLHQTRVTHSIAAWNGVRRSMRTINLPRGPVSGRGGNSFVDAIRDAGVTGEVAVTSVHVLVYSREGERLFEGSGGLEFVHDVDMAGVKKTYKFGLSLREDLFQDPDLLREGVEVAFDPYLPASP